MYNTRKKSVTILFTRRTESIKKSKKIKDSVRCIKSMLKEFF